MSSTIARYLKALGKAKNPHRECWTERVELDMITTSFKSMAELERWLHIKHG